jgi:hypothetical protein
MLAGAVAVAGALDDTLDGALAVTLVGAGTALAVRVDALDGMLGGSAGAVATGGVGVAAATGRRSGGAAGGLDATLGGAATDGTYPGAGGGLTALGAGWLAAPGAGGSW